MAIHQQQRAKPGTLTSKVRRIVIGDWNLESINSDDLIMKCYFAKRKLLLEILDRSAPPDNEGHILKRKMEINWSDLLSFQMHTEPGDSTGVLRLELSRCPIFSIETNQRPKKHTQWRGGEDFTTNSSASIYRIHTLYFSPGELQKNFEKLRSGDVFWSKLATTPFPISTSPFYELNVNQNVAALNNETNLQIPNLNSVKNSYYPLSFGAEAANTMINNSYPMDETEARPMMNEGDNLGNIDLNYTSHYEQQNLQTSNMSYYSIGATNTMINNSYPIVETEARSMMYGGENLENIEYRSQYEEGNLQTSNMSYYPLIGEGETNTMINNSYPIVETEAREMVTEERDLHNEGYFSIPDTIAYSQPIQGNSMTGQRENLRNMEYSGQYEERNLQMSNTTPMYVDNLGNMVPPPHQEEEEGNLRTMNEPRKFLPPF